jgi:hypothetical protein
MRLSGNDIFKNPLLFKITGQDEAKIQSRSCFKVVLSKVWHLAHVH